MNRLLGSSQQLGEIVVRSASNLDRGHRWESTSVFDCVQSCVRFGRQAFLDIQQGAASNPRIVPSRWDNGSVLRVAAIGLQV
jgi:hypothetical protein